jgi:hypothetical protein
MQKYRGVVMGRRKINNNETEVEIEGPGDDHEPQGLALLVTEFGKFRQLDEYQEPTEGDRPKSMKP